MTVDVHRAFLHLVEEIRAGPGGPASNLHGD